MLSEIIWQQRIIVSSVVAVTLTLVIAMFLGSRRNNSDIELRLVPKGAIAVAALLVIGWARIGWVRPWSEAWDVPALSTIVFTLALVMLARGTSLAPGYALGRLAPEQGTKLYAMAASSRGTVMGFEMLLLALVGVMGLITVLCIV